MEKKSTRRKSNAKVYDPQHRRRGNQNAKGGSADSHLKHVKICLYYGERINHFKSPDILLKQYEKLDPSLYTSILLEQNSGKKDLSQSDLLQKVQKAFSEKKETKNLPNIIWTYTELISDISNKFFLSESSIISILDDMGNKFRIKSIRLSLKDSANNSLTHQQHLEIETARIEFMIETQLNDIHERTYKNESDKQKDIDNIHQCFEEEYKKLSLLKRRALENPSGQAYEELPLKPKTYLARILSSSSYINYLAYRKKWDKEQNKLKSMD